MTNMLQKSLNWARATGCTHTIPGNPSGSCAGVPRKHSLLSAAEAGAKRWVMTGFLLPGDALSGDSGRKRVFIHIGLHKTGTSSIQQFLTANRDVLERNRVLYPAGISGGQAHHSSHRFFSDLIQTRRFRIL